MVIGCGSPPHVVGSRSADPGHGLGDVALHPAAPLAGDAEPALALGQRFAADLARVQADVGDGSGLQPHQVARVEFGIEADDPLRAGLLAQPAPAFEFDQRLTW